jgi:hypothetical protein
MRMATAANSLDQYADSMFRYEQLHPDWIDACARYLRHIFGVAIEGRVFLDYAFGRGNWSLAALKAGASSVVAIDAAAGNVQRFSDYCRKSNIRNIEIIRGNILSGPIERQADILWIYGILPNITEPDVLISRLCDMRRDDTALALLYAYDAGSLRQVIVDAARRGCTYASEQSFVEDSFLFTPSARLRARDDLTAPAVTWNTAHTLCDLAMRHGMVPQRQHVDFREWLTGVSSQEFSPHHLLCGFGKRFDATIIEPKRPQAADYTILASVAKSILAVAAADQRRKLAIGLFNTHFSALRIDETAKSAVIDDFLFFIHAALRLDISAAVFEENSRSYYCAALAATCDRPRGFSAHQLSVSPLANFLDINTVRF